ncbi:MAG: phospholipase D family protein, partial [Acidobacteria bacterium]|nr:phospholipase D family protein [Candidatus Sulfomarinibacter kjeldsenii]
DYPPPPHSVTLEPDPATSLGQLTAEFSRRHGTGISGYAAVDLNSDGLQWRLAMVDTAERSLDILYYLWYDDLGGLLLLEHVIEAAERGVRVRIVVDDALFLGGKQGLANLDAHPKIEFRVFNPWASKGAARAFETVGRMKKLNHRMHNKLLIADGHMAILGGRNVGDHYFGLHHKYNFHDLDIVVLGDEAAESSEIFDHFWNSEQVMPAGVFVDESSWEDIEGVRTKELDRLRNAEELAEFPLERRDWSDELSALVEGMSPGTSTVEYDRVLPDTAAPTQDGVVELAGIVEQAQREVLILNAYIIPGETMMQILREAVGRGVRVRALTNSLASNDVPAVTAKYKKYRKPLLEAGVELYEFRAHPEIQVGIVDTAPVEAGFAGLHTKAVVVDREIVYVGSLNLDPRSIQLNTEMGMIVSSPGLAEEVAAIAERDMAPTNSWRVLLDENGELFWESVEGIVKKQPAQSSWQRIQMWFFGIAPEGQL